jgi:hypothetical protein
MMQRKLLQLGTYRYRADGAGLPLRDRLAHHLSGPMSSGDDAPVTGAPAEISRLVDGSGGHRAAAAALCPGPVRRDRGVALDAGDIADIGAERVGGQLNDGGF